MKRLLGKVVMALLIAGLVTLGIAAINIYSHSQEVRVARRALTSESLVKHFGQKLSNEMGEPVFVLHQQTMVLLVFKVDGEEYAAGFVPASAGEWVLALIQPMEEAND